MCVLGPIENGRQRPEGRHQQTQVSDCGVARGAEDSEGEDEGECQENQELHRELKSRRSSSEAAVLRLGWTDKCEKFMISLITGRN